MIALNSRGATIHVGISSDGTGGISPGTGLQDLPDGSLQLASIASNHRLTKPSWLEDVLSPVKTTRCPECSDPRFYRSRFHGLWEKIARIFLVRPVRCYSCARRYWTSALMSTRKQAQLQNRILYRPMK